MDREKPTLAGLFATGTKKEISQTVDKHHPSDIAEALTDLDAERLELVVETFGRKRLSEVLSHTEASFAARILAGLPENKAAKVLTGMNGDAAADILKTMTSTERYKYFAHMTAPDKEKLRALARYQEETAGSIMTTDYIAIQKDMDVKDAMRTLVKNANTTEGIQRLFVLDENGALEGAINLKRLIQARSPGRIADLMATEIITVQEDTDSEEAARLMQGYEIPLLPVVDEKNRLKGVITMDDAADVLDAETDEDYARFAAISADRRVHVSIFASALHRLPWLLLLLVLGLVISTIISRFESTLEAVVVLVFFQPLILDMAGNTGTQSLAVTVRGISKGAYPDRTTIFGHMFKEFRIGALNGLAIGSLSCLTSFAFLTVTGAGANPPILVALTIGLSLAVALAFASFFGAFIPMTLHRLKADPAVASGPFITTLNDILGLIIYFSLASFIILRL